MYSKFVGAFDANKIAAFMSRAVAGRKSTSKLVGEGPIALDASRDCLASYVKLSAEIAAADAESGGLDEEEEDMLAEIRAEEEAERDALEAELAAQAKAEKAAAELAAAQEKEDAKTEGSSRRRTGRHHKVRGAQLRDCDDESDMRWISGIKIKRSRTTLLAAPEHCAI